MVSAAVEDMNLELLLQWLIVQWSLLVVLCAFAFRTLGDSELDLKTSTENLVV